MNSVTNCMHGPGCQKTLHDLCRPLSCCPLSKHADSLPWIKTLKFAPWALGIPHVEYLPNPLFIIKSDNQEASGCTQLCGGQLLGTEAAVHTARKCLESDDSQALNRKAALHNIRRICPELVPFSLTHTGSLQIYWSMVTAFSPKRALPKVTPWPCPCMLSQVLPS